MSGSLAWDDQKTGDYPFQTEFSYQMNQLSRRRWYTYNAIGGVVLGAVMAVLVFLVPETYFSDPARLVIALFIGAWPPKVMAQNAERSTRVAQLAMVLTFAAGTALYALRLLITGG